MVGARCAVVTALMLVSASGTAASATYYVSATGSDKNDGRTTRKPWKTLERVNAAALKPGDTVRFRRGDIWRGSLRAKSGAAGKPVVYSCYGKGPKPTLLGSVARNAPADWHDEGGGVWSTGGVPAPPEVAVPPADAAERARRWSLYVEGGAAAHGEPTAGAESPAAFRVVCDQAGKASSDMQLCMADLTIRAGRTYRLLIHARATQPFDVAMPQLMRAAPPWSSFSSGPPAVTLTVREETTTLCQYYTASATTDKARLTLDLGGAMPDKTTLDIDRVSFAECSPREIPPDSLLPVDVGNLIFANEQSCGWKVWRRADVNQLGRYWYDRRAQKVYLFCDGNPAARYHTIECALHHHIIDESGCSYVTYENLALKYGAAHGIGGGATAHITVRQCDISFIGGADQYQDGRNVRFGNGIEFWGAAHGNLVEGCRIWEVYDAALTNQNAGDIEEEADITYRNNIIWNSEYSFEYWNRPQESVTRSIRFVHNTCVNAGHGWSHAQRPDPSGRHLCLYDSQAKESDIVIKNNIFFEATANALYAPTWSPDRFARLDLDGNLWSQRAGAMVSVNGQFYPMDQFDRYRSAYRKEPRSVVGNPRFADAARRDFRLLPGSPCIGAGVPVGVATDYAGRAFRADAPDIGAFSRGR